MTRPELRAQLVAILLHDAMFPLRPAALTFDKNDGWSSRDVEKAREGLDRAVKIADMILDRCLLP
jgi:hypothetical protein